MKKSWQTEFVLNLDAFWLDTHFISLIINMKKSWQTEFVLNLDAFFIQTRAFL
jgi:hypothetical protein